MELHSSITSLVIVLLAAFLTPIVLNKLRLNIIPVVVAEIIVGLILGHSGFDIIHPGDWINILSTLGFIFLMFLSGLEIDFSVFFSAQAGKSSKQNKEPNPFLVSVIIFALILLVSYLISVFLVFGGFTESAFFMTLVISTISLGIVVPTLKESNVMNTSIGQTILIIAVIADLVTMILLAVFVSFSEGGGSTWLLLILFGAGVILYFIAKFFRHRTLFETLSTGTVQIGTRGIFTLIILLVALSESVGAENILGAFLAGVLVSLLSPNKEMVKQLDSFGYGFLIPIFFVMVGVDLDLGYVLQHKSVLLLIPILFIGLLLSKMIPVLVLKKWYDWRTVLGSGFLLTSTLSLVVAASKVGERIGVISSGIASALILLAVITCIVTPVLFKKIFPFQGLNNKRKTVAILGANQVTLPLLNQLDANVYDVKLYSTNIDRQTVDTDVRANVSFIENFSSNTLENEGIFSVDTIVVATKNDKQNVVIAECAEQREVRSIIARVESPEQVEILKKRGINVVSSFFSTQSMIKAMVESPNIANLFTTSEEGLNQIELKNSAYDHAQVRDITNLGDAIIVRIYRENNSIIPHGNTKLNIGDRLILSGSPSTMQRLREEL